jgi:hypothetical protein
MKSKGIATMTTQDIKQAAIRIDNDINGNPRYYFPKYMFPAMDDKTRLRAGLNLYRGKKYGAGYVMQSYYLDGDIEYALYAIENEV